MSSLLTNGRNAGQGTNPNFIVLNLFGGVLDQKLKVLLSVPLTASFNDVALQDCQTRDINRPYRDAQDRLLWKDKTCPART